MSNKKKSFEQSHVLVSKKLMEDLSISAQCTRMLVYLLTKPENYTIQLKELCGELKTCGIGRDKMYKLVNEAIKAKYIKRIDKPLEGNLRKGYEYELNLDK